MLIVDLPREFGAGRSRRVCVLGSCRVKNPFSALTTPNRMNLVWRVQPFTHTVPEAQQILDHASGQLDIADDLAPFVFGTETTPSPAEYPANLLDDVDTFVVEVATQQVLRFHDLAFQGALFNRAFLQRYGAPLLRWNRAVTLGHEVDANLLASTREALEADGFTVTPRLDDMLRNIRMEWQDAAVMAAQMRRLMFDPGRRWIFVSHIVVPGMAGKVMRDRAMLNQAVAEAAGAVGAECFDPTMIFARLPRKLLLDADGADIYEYAPKAFAHLGSMMLEVLRAPGNGARAHFAPWLADMACRLPPFVENEEWARVPEPRNALAEWVRDWMVAFYAARAEKLGVDAAGLGIEFIGKLRSRTIVPSAHLGLINLLDGYLPHFDEIVVSRAGIGEVALPLAAMGYSVTACETSAARRAALEAAAAALGQVLPAAADRIRLSAELLPDAGHCGAGRRLFIGIDLIAAPKDHPRLLQHLASFDAALLSGRSFLHVRRTPEERRALAGELKEAGFHVVRDYPYQGLLYVEALPPTSPTAMLAKTSVKAPARPRRVPAIRAKVFA